MANYDFDNEWDSQQSTDDTYEQYATTEEDEPEEEEQQRKKRKITVKEQGKEKDCKERTCLHLFPTQGEKEHQGEERDLSDPRNAKAPKRSNSSFLISPSPSTTKEKNKGK